MSGFQGRLKAFLFRRSFPWLYRNFSTFRPLKSFFLPTYCLVYKFWSVHLFVVDDISVEFRASCLSLDTDPFCHESTSDEYLFLQTVPSRVFAEQLTYKDAVSFIDFTFCAVSVLVLCVYEVFFWFVLVKMPDSSAQVSYEFMHWLRLFKHVGSIV